MRRKGPCTPRQIAYLARSQITLADGTRAIYPRTRSKNVESLGSVAKDCREATEQLSRDLAGAGLRVTRSFDLQSARQALRDPEGCPCPHHGTTDCTCQYVVLLVGLGTEPPLTLVAHGHDGATQLSMDAVGPGTNALEIVRAAIAGQHIMEKER